MKARRSIGGRVATSGTALAVFFATSVVTACSETKAPPTEPAGSVAEASAPTAAPDPEAPRAPLTGLPVDPALIERPAVVVKIDNDPRAMPQDGLNQADLVYEVAVEGTTRFAAVFHSADAPRVGPVRSARSTDIDLIGGLGHPLLAFSGANGGVLAELATAEQAGTLVAVPAESHPLAFTRDGDRDPPYNLYTSTDVIRAVRPDQREVARPVFDYGAPPEGEASLGVGITWSSPWVRQTAWIWDDAAQAWMRHQLDLDHNRGDLVVRGADGVAVQADNVVVIEAPYQPSMADQRSPQAITVGSGVALVLYQGEMVIGGWHRPTTADGWGLTDAAGAPIRLPPGRTWVTVAPPGSSLPLSEESRSRFTGA